MVVKQNLIVEKTQLGNTNTSSPNRNLTSVASSSHKVSVSNPQELEFVNSHDNNFVFVFEIGRAHV